MVVTPNQELASTSAKFLKSSAAGPPKWGVIRLDVPHEVEMMVARIARGRSCNRDLEQTWSIRLSPEGAFTFSGWSQASAEENGAECPRAVKE